MDFKYAVWSFYVLNCVFMFHPVVKQALEALELPLSEGNQLALRCLLRWILMNVCDWSKLAGKMKPEKQPWMKFWRWSSQIVDFGYVSFFEALSTWSWEATKESVVGKSVVYFFFKNILFLFLKVVWRSKPSVFTAMTFHNEAFCDCTCFQSLNLKMKKL